MDKQTNKEIKCCFCNEIIKGHGHNPVPLYNKEGRCCTLCNFTKVLPARLTLKDFNNGKDERYLHSNEE